MTIKTAISHYLISSHRIMSQKSITSFFKPREPAKKRELSPDTTTSKKIKFVVSDVTNSPSSNLWVEKIKAKAMKVRALHESIGVTWYRALEKEFDKEYFVKLSEFVAQERKKSTIYPPEDKVYTWTQLCPIREVKVVILGQDPYHNVGQAHGLCFSVPKGVGKPPSLINIFKELESDIDGFKTPIHGDLTGWAKQGVLLLNAVLTVRPHSANSHADKGWEKLTDAVIKWINENTHGVVFMLWGSYAQKKGALIDLKRHKVLKTVHPSPLSAHRGFLGCKHFSQANEALKKLGKTPIDWKDL